MYMETKKVYSGGQFCATEQQYAVKNPYSGEEIAKVYLAGTAELENAIGKAQAVKEQLANMPAYERSDALKTVAQYLQQRRQLIAETLSLEAAKPIKLALGEVDRAIQTFLVGAEEAKRLPSEYISLDWTPAGRGKEGIVKYFPVGLVAAISPFNFPLNLTAHKLAPAIAAGCPIILKPARSTPLSALMLAEAFDATSLPKGSVSILPMDRISGNQLVTDDRFALLTFTGSPQVGWKMKNEAGRKRVVLELGGNAGVIVTESCALEEAVKLCVAGAFSYSGQVCIHTQRIYVQNSIFDRFLDQFLELTSRLKVGAPNHPDTDISSMIDEANAIRVEQWVGEAVGQGAKVLFGGKRSGTIFGPTVLSGTTPSMKVCSLEVFGPVVTIERFGQFDEAVAAINSSSYGLQAGVFTNNINEMNHAFRDLNVGGVIINDVPTFRVDHMPYGGTKDSGMGREGVKYAMHDMLEPRLLVKNIC